VYVLFVALAQPIVPVLNGDYGDNSLIILAATASLLMPVPLIVAASLSQFSAAVADTVAAAANMKEGSQQRIKLRWGYLLVGVAAMALAWSRYPFAATVVNVSISWLLHLFSALCWFSPYQQVSAAKPISNVKASAVTHTSLASAWA